jgi:uncharacterized protein (DUF1778 family)
MGVRVEERGGFFWVSEDGVDVAAFDDRRDAIDRAAALVGLYPGDAELEAIYQRAIADGTLTERELNESFERFLDRPMPSDLEPTR